MHIEDKVAVITGGASGLGRATAKTVIEAGGKVAILDLNADLAEQTAGELGDNAAAFAVNVTDAASAETAVDAVMARFGAIHIDVNCAGIGAAARTVGREGPLDLAAFNFVIQVNLVGTFNTLRLCAHHMAKNEPIGADEAYPEPEASLVRRGVPEDLTGVMTFLFTDDARFISGQMIVVNGGREVH